MSKPVCQHCGSTNTAADSLVKEYWCYDCWEWSDKGDPGEESREQIASRENAIMDKQER